MENQKYEAKKRRRKAKRQGLRFLLIVVCGCGGPMKTERCGNGIILENGKYLLRKRKMVRVKRKEKKTIIMVNFFKK